MRLRIRLMLIPIGLASYGAVCGTGPAEEAPPQERPSTLDLAIHSLEDCLYRDGPSTPAAIEEVEWRARQVEKAAARATFGAARGETIHGALEIFRRRAGQSLVRWTANSTLADLRAQWETTCRPHLAQPGSRHVGTASLDAAQRMRDPPEDNDLLDRLDFVERQYEEMLLFAARLRDSDRRDGSFRDEASRWSRRIRAELWRPPLPLTAQAPDNLRRAWRVLAESRSVIQALLSTTWTETFVESAHREIPQELDRVRRSRQEILRAYFPR